MEQTRINITLILRIALILSFMWLSACGGSDDPPPPDPAKSSTWGEMNWGEGTWGK